MGEYKRNNNVTEMMLEKGPVGGYTRRKKCLWRLLMVLVVLVLLALGAVVIVQKLGKTECEQPLKAIEEASTSRFTKRKDDRQIADTEEYCAPSAEAQRIGLNDVLQRAQDLLFETTPFERAYEPGYMNQDKANKIMRRFKPYNPDPMHTKYIADQIQLLLRDIENLKPDKMKMKPKEVQTLSEIRVMLDQFFGSHYDQDYYGGDWMLGPNYFCFNNICKLKYEIRTFLYLFRPKTSEDVRFLISTLKGYEKTVDRYIENLKLGVNAGMVQPYGACKAGADAFKQQYLNLILHGQNYGTRMSEFANYIYSDRFYKQLDHGVEEEWDRKNTWTLRKAVRRAFKDGVSSSIIRLYYYLTQEHIKYCPPDEEASGLAQLPLKFVYVNGKADYSRPTTGKLPGTDIKLDGRELYRRTVPRYTTTDISPEEIYAEGKRQIDIIYPEMEKIAKEYTKIDDNEKAIAEIRRVINSDDQWHGVPNFPANESGTNAHKKCVDDKSAKKHCPVRWKSMQEWISSLNGILSMIHSRLYRVFHFTGDRISVPSCPIVIRAQYNPSNGAMHFAPSDPDCSTPTQIVFPFFLERYGPRFQEWSVVGHEGRPGHHFQYQGTQELFQNPCTEGLASFFHTKGHFTGFLEGWALYAENPVLSDDVGLYKENLLQKLGMYKWQIWRAVRLVVDTGLHYRGENSTWALQQIDKYALDATDFGKKEVTRYMSWPGQATSYMIGRLAILKARKKAERMLKQKFDLKDFHYQILSIGQAPLDYITYHVDRYIECVLDPSIQYCEYILTPVKSVPKTNRAPTTHGNRHLKVLRPQFEQVF